MANYFDTFPKIEYQMKKNGIPKKVTDITKRVGFRKDFVDYVSDYYKHVISSGERPEMVSVQAYDTPLNHWILMMVNEVVDPYHDWVRDYNALEEYIDKRYPNAYALLDGNYDRTPHANDYVYTPLVGTFPAHTQPFVNDYPYEIVTLGDTNWSAIGASTSPSVGEVFTKDATTATGTGTARPLQPWATTSEQHIEVVEIDSSGAETGVSATLYVWNLNANGLPVIGGNAGEYVKPNWVYNFTNGNYFTKGNKLRHIAQYATFGSNSPDMDITSHLGAKVISSDPDNGSFTYKILSPSTNGITNFNTTDYNITTQDLAIKISEAHLEKNMPRYYEISKTNDDGTVEKLQVNRTLSSADIAALPSGFSTTPVAVTNMEYEFLKNTQDSEIFVVNENNISAIEKELIAKMEQ